MQTGRPIGGNVGQNDDGPAEITRRGRRRISFADQSATAVRKGTAQATSVYSIVLMSTWA